MNTLKYLQLANAHDANSGENTTKEIRITLITNFTDAVLQKLLTGVLVEGGYAPKIHATPYQQYHLELNNKKSTLFNLLSNFTFIFFDANPYRHSAFVDDETHVRETLEELKAYCAKTDRPVVMMTFITPYRGAYGNLFTESPLHKHIEWINSELKKMSNKIENFYLCDINALVHNVGEAHIRDFRGSYAFDTPFSNDFLLTVAKEWRALVRAFAGGARKCVVVDLDNTLWGGVVGELGAEGIILGPDYPGIAFQNFQRALISLYERGVILAISSKNNLTDVLEVFQQNTHMLLKENHFAAIRANWNDKAKNIIEIAKEINIGLDSIVFLDDDPINRELVRTVLPDVLVPELPHHPEEYVSALYALDAFHQIALTKEDREKGKMYADERKRKEIAYSAENVKDYISALGITVNMRKNDPEALPRIAQLTQKTNQFNVTTKRYGEKEIATLAGGGANIYSGDISDKFGDYGKTIVAIVTFPEKRTAHLDTYLMSCRVMGRGVEIAFLQAILEDLKREGVTTITAQFIPSPKNDPAKNFFLEVGFAEVGRIGDTINYSGNISQ